MKMPYGNHKDEEIEDLPSDYLGWIAENWDENSIIDEEICRLADEEFQYRTKYNCHWF